MPVVLNSGLSVKAKPQNIMCHHNTIKKIIKNMLQKGPETEKKVWPKEISFCNAKIALNIPI